MNATLQQSRGERIRLVVAYDGGGFHGFARQSGLRTVQGVLEETLSDMLGTTIEVHGSGRTDKGVHARAQVVHYDQPYGPPADRVVHVLERRLPPDVIPVSAVAVDSDFHARFSVVRKSYRYALYRRKTPDLFQSRFTWHLRDSLNVEAMSVAAQFLVGSHDFTSFCAAAAPQQDKVRTVYRVDVVDEDDNLYLYCEGNGFLQYMVRIMTGTLVDVGLGQIEASAIPSILQGRDRTLSGQTAPAHGLCLWNVEYPMVYGGKVLDLPERL